MKKFSKLARLARFRSANSTQLAQVHGGNNDPVPGIDIICEKCPTCEGAVSECDCGPTTMVSGGGSSLMLRR